MQRLKRGFYSLIVWVSGAVVLASLLSLIIGGAICSVFADMADELKKETE